MVRQVVLSQVVINFDTDALGRAKIPNPVFTGAGFPVTPPQTASGSNGIQTKLRIQPLDAVGTEGTSQGENPFASPKKAHLVLDMTADAADPTDTGSQHSVALTDIDCIQPIHDQLQLNWWWWILEVIPMTYSYQDGKGKWHTNFG